MKRILMLQCLAIAAASLPNVGRAEGEEKIIRLGLIGLDTSHVIAFTSYLNNPKSETGCRVVAAFPGGSADFPASANRVEGFTQQLREKHGVEMVDSIEELCKKVDGILLESVDGRPHLEQARIVINAGKPLFVDKPVADDLADVITLFRLAKEKNVPCWSSSAMRFGEGVAGDSGRAGRGWGQPGDRIRRLECHRQGQRRGPEDRAEGHSRIEGQGARGDGDGWRAGRGPGRR